jgi:hypothetical protein
VAPELGGRRRNTTERCEHVEDHRALAREACLALQRCEGGGGTFETISNELRPQGGQVHMSPSVAATTEDAEGGEGLRPAARKARGFNLVARGAAAGI